MRRHAIAVIAVLLLMSAAWFYVRPPSGPAGQEWQAACGRIGAVMVVVWLAYDQLRRFPVWLWWTFPFVFVTLAFRPRWLVILVPVLIVLAILKPRTTSRKP